MKIYLIDSAQNFIDLLSSPITTYFNQPNDNKSLYNKWKFNFIELYNNRSEFLCMANTNLDGKNLKEEKILNSNFNENYSVLKNNFHYISKKLKLWNDKQLNISDDHFILNINSTNINPYNNDIIFDIIEQEKVHKSLLELNMFRFMVFIYQYLNIFDEQSIHINLWNYCLRSSTFSYKCFFLGIFTLMIQFIWVGALLFDVIHLKYYNSNDNRDNNTIYINDNSESATNNSIIIIIAILSTILSLLYSYNTIKSYYYSRKLYKFLINVYADYPELSLSKDQRLLLFYKKRNISMKLFHIKYNWWADFLSNCILPLGIPIINFFIIEKSDSVIDAILNSVAIFFIVQIDEDLYNYSDYNNEKNTINFTRWIISTIYCSHFPLFKDIFQLECENWFSRIFKLSKKFKKNKVGISQN